LWCNNIIFCVVNLANTRSGYGFCKLNMAVNKTLRFNPLGVDFKYKVVRQPFNPDGQGGYRMAAKKKDIYIMPRKIYWHLYSLQNLNGEKFVKVVNKVLKKEYMLIK